MMTLGADQFAERDMTFILISMNGIKIDAVKHRENGDRRADSKILKTIFFLHLPDAANHLYSAWHRHPYLFLAAENRFTLCSALLVAMHFHHLGNTGDGIAKFLDPDGASRLLLTPSPRRCVFPVRATLRDA
ncbi:hypothetical protein [Herbaspirillum rubrisubalbicans]|uniref:hypothetical protein n=1 Tax=Herbaspirillum rubrisubalbicans TaxID=80842 RepID=UPI0015C56337|nr:hypothetical protein [Herbaspirillum rubrisubalbicans]NQE51323.1 hypothetical protein [Herbaspirillum rubrisubalbicans]